MQVMENNELIQYDLSKPAQTIQFAEVLARFITERKLTTNIQGKPYVNVEGWCFAGSQLGLIPILTSLTDLSNFDTDPTSTQREIKYKAEIELRRISDDKLMGRGFAICSNKERTKKSFEEYAIASMAQTRAEGKAFRMLLSWLMKAAGFETTPTEEMMDTPEADEIGDDSRFFLRELLRTSMIDEKRKEDFELRIDSLILWTEYHKAKDYLMQVQPKDEDKIKNGFYANQGDTNKAVRKAVQADNT